MGMSDSHDVGVPPHEQLVALHRDLGVAERTAAELRVRISDVETAIAAASRPAPERPAPPAPPVLRIRLLGNEHATFKDRAELTVVGNAAHVAAAADAVLMGHACELVADGRAEWIDPPL